MGRDGLRGSHKPDPRRGLPYKLVPQHDVVVTLNELVDLLLRHEIAIMDVRALIALQQTPDVISQQALAVRLQLPLGEIIKDFE